MSPGPSDAASAHASAPTPRRTRRVLMVVCGVAAGVALIASLVGGREEAIVLGEHRFVPSPEAPVALEVKGRIHYVGKDQRRRAVVSRDAFLAACALLAVAIVVAQRDSRVR